MSTGDVKSFTGEVTITLDCGNSIINWQVAEAIAEKSGAEFGDVRNRSAYYIKAADGIVVTYALVKNVVRRTFERWPSVLEERPQGIPIGNLYPERVTKLLWNSISVQADA